MELKMLYPSLTFTILKLFSYFHHRFSISREILCAASEYFATMLASNFNDSERSESILRDVDSDAVQAIVNFCYTGRIELNEDNVDEFITNAAYYKIDRLRQKCCEFKSAALNASTAATTLLVADQFNFSDLRGRALDLVCANFDSIASTDIQQLDHQLLEELLQSDAVRASEETIFKRLMDWYEHNKIDRKKFMADLLKCIHLNTFLTDFRLKMTKRFTANSIVWTYN